MSENHSIATPTQTDPIRALEVKILNTYGPTGSGIIAAGMFAGSSSAPQVAVNTAGAGVGGSATLSAHGHDNVMQITVVTSGTPGTGSSIFDVTFSKPYTNAPLITFGPGNAAAAALPAARIPFPSPTVSGFSFISNGTGLSAAATYVWNFMVMEI